MSDIQEFDDAFIAEHYAMLHRMRVKTIAYRIAVTALSCAALAATFVAVDQKYFSNAKDTNEA